MNFPLYASAMLGASTALGLMALPAVRQYTFGSIRHHWLCHELDFDRLDHDGKTVIMKNGDYVRVIKIAGTSYETKAEEHQDNLLKGRSVVLNGLGDDGIILRLFAVKRQCDVSFTAHWPSPVLTEIGQAESKIFAKTYDLEWFAMLQSRSHAKLMKACKRVMQSLKGEYGARVISDGALLSFINYLISGAMLDPSHLEGISNNISAALPASDVSFDKQSGNITTTTPKHRVSRILSVRAYSEMVDGMLFADILALHGEIEIMQLIEAQDRNRSIFQLTSKRNEQSNAFDFLRNTALLEETEALLDLINSGSCNLFFTQLTIRLCGESEKVVDALQEQVAEILGKRRITWSLDTRSAPNYYFNRFPGHDFQSRELKLLNPNIAALWTFHNSPSGQKTSPWGDQPLRLFKTPIGQNYSFNFHVRDSEGSPGHALVIAPTGSGKSTLMMHLLGGMAKFPDVRSYIFDSNEGTRYMVEAMGGFYQSTSEMQFNPLDCEDTENNRLHIANLLRTMGEISDQEIQQFLWTAFDCLERDKRSFNAVFDAVFAKDKQSRKDFARWVLDEEGNKGLYAGMFNATHDSLGGTLNQSFMTAINMADALNDDVLAAPLVAHIAEGIKHNAMQNSKGFAIFVDEAAALPRNKGFADLVQVMYREYRKLGGAVIAAFQDPKAIQDSSAASAVLDNTSTLIFFPNAQASQADYACFNLSDEQMKFITGGSDIASDRSVLVIKREASSGYEESTIIEINLAMLGNALRVYRSGTKANAELAALKQSNPDNWRAGL